MANQDFSKIKPFGPKPEGESSQATMAMLQKLQQKNAQNGIVKSEGEDPNLTPAEQEKYKKIFKVFKDVVFPGPEAAKVESTKQKKKPGIAQQMTSSVMKAPDVKSPSSWIGALIAAFALMPWKDIFHSIIKSIKGVLSFKALSKMLGLGKLLQFGKMKFLNLFDSAVDFLKNSRFIKALGGGLDTIKDFFSSIKSNKFVGKLMDMVQTFKNLFSGFGKVFDAVSTPLKFVGGTIFKGAGFLLKTVGKIGAKFSKVLKFVPFIGPLFNFATAVQAFGNGEYGRGLIEIVSGVLGFIPGVGTLASGLIDGATLLYDIFSENETGKDTRSMLGGVGGFLSSMMKTVADAVMGVFSWIGDGIKNIFSGFKNIVSNIFETGADLFAGALEYIPGIGGFLGDGVRAIKNFIFDDSSSSSSGGSSSGGGGSSSSPQVSVTDEGPWAKYMRDAKEQELTLMSTMVEKLHSIDKKMSMMTSGGGISMSPNVAELSFNDSGSPSY